MDTTTPQSRRLHPLVAAAAVSVIAVSALGAWALVDKQVSARHSDAVYSAVTDAVPGSAASPANGEAPVAPPTAAPVESKPAPRPAAKPAAAKKPAPAQVAQAPAVSPSVPEYVPPPRSVAPPVVEPAPVCLECGTVVAVREVKQPGQANGVGAVTGGVLGVVIGNQVGEGRGRDVARVLGAVGGAVAGHQVEKRVRTNIHYEVDVRMDDGSVQTVRRDTAPLTEPGARVRVQGGQLLHNDGSVVAGRAPAASAAPVNPGA